jgi:hypothetical protein
MKTTTNIMLNVQTLNAFPSSPSQRSETRQGCLPSLMLHTNQSQRICKQLPELINKFSKVAGYMIKTKISYVPRENILNDTSDKGL